MSGNTPPENNNNNKEQSEVVCTAINPNQSLRVHPDAIIDRSSFDGSDDHYICPHCKVGWWVEYDG